MVVARAVFVVLVALGALACGSEAEVGEECSGKQDCVAEGRLGQPVECHEEICREHCTDAGQCVDGTVCHPSENVCVP